MTYLHQEFTVYPAGQGLFYSGIISVQSHLGLSNPFKLVFDCGSFNYSSCREEVTTFRENYLSEGRRLELLVISHFDKDHVNFVGTLLDGGVKVDRVILPFATFEERLFLVLRYLMEAGGKEGDATTVDFFIRFTLDPIGTLGGNLDDGSRVYFITDGPRPTPPQAADTPSLEEGGQDASDVDNFSDRVPDLEFGFNGKSKIVSDTVLEQFSVGGQSPGITLREMEDSVKGRLSVIGTSVKVMEFIFYRKSISSDDLGLCRKIYEAFCVFYGIGMALPADEVRERIIEVLIKMRDGREVKIEIYEPVVSVFPDLTVSKKGAMNLNTTALSMLHLNSGSFASMRHVDYLDIYRGVFLIQKFDGTNGKRAEFQLPEYGWYPHPLARIIGNPFPNCLLTSDSVLLLKGDVDDFFRKYSPYWQRLWLFQIPHHGSKNNADRELFSRVGRNAKMFNNYGINSKPTFGHPSPSMFVELKAVGRNDETLAINEYNGLRFIHKVYF